MSSTPTRKRPREDENEKEEESFWSRWMRTPWSRRKRQRTETTTRTTSSTRSLPRLNLQLPSEQQREQRQEEETTRTEETTTTAAISAPASTTEYTTAMTRFGTTTTTATSLWCAGPLPIYSPNLAIGHVRRGGGGRRRPGRPGSRISVRPRRTYRSREHSYDPALVQRILNESQSLFAPTSNMYTTTAMIGRPQSGIIQRGSGLVQPSATRKVDTMAKLRRDGNSRKESFGAVCIENLAKLGDDMRSIYVAFKDLVDDSRTESFGAIYIQHLAKLGDNMKSVYATIVDSVDESMLTDAQIQEMSQHCDNVLVDTMAKLRLEGNSKKESVGAVCVENMAKLGAIVAKLGDDMRSIYATFGGLVDNSRKEYFATQCLQTLAKLGDDMKSVYATFVDSVDKSMLTDYAQMQEMSQKVFQLE